MKTINLKVVLPEKANMVEDFTKFTINGTKYKFLEAEYGVPASEWKKVRGEGVVAIGDGKRAELHWYESDSTGIVKMKVKRFFE